MKWEIPAWILVVIGIIAAGLRFVYGLGATTALTNFFPWGIWIGFDFICIGLAAAGFTIAAIVHIFKLKRFESIVRPSILVAFIGYIIVVFFLIVDLGLPLSAWHPLVMWNPHSVMFEITWCILLYSSILILELLPVLLEKLDLKNRLSGLLSAFLKFCSPAIVVTGVILSTLHQSSFGSLYLIMPSKMSALWYSNIIPVLFYISCLAAGLAMSIVTQIAAARQMGHKVNFKLLEELSSYIVVILAVYGTVRFQDLIARGVLMTIFSLSFQPLMFWAEIIIGIVIPMILLINTTTRHMESGVHLASWCVLGGFMLNRINTTIIAFNIGMIYIPSLIEIAVVVGLVAAGFLAYSYISKNFNIF